MTNICDRCFGLFKSKEEFVNHDKLSCQDIQGFINKHCAKC